VSKTQFFLHL